jgi:hypothetical protein
LADQRLSHGNEEIKLGVNSPEKITRKPPVRRIIYQASFYKENKKICRIKYHAYFNKESSIYYQCP